MFGLLTTAQTASRRGVTVAEVLTSLIVFTLLYGVLAVVEVRLMLRYVKAGRRRRRAADRATPASDADRTARAFAY